MKSAFITALSAAALLIASLPAVADPIRQDAIWARSTNGAPITLDGVLDEPAWAAAETKVVRYGVDNGIPGSGYQEEAGVVTKDSVYATLKFLVVGNQLYLGAVVRDSSVGGSTDFNRFDGFLMALKDHSGEGHPAPPAEYLYSWWYQIGAVGNPTAPGRSPTFGGRWASPPWGSPRTPEQIAAWDAVTRVQGLSNSDTAPDTGYVVEMRFDLGVMGYDVTQPTGDIVEWNISIYDCDWFWPINAARFSANRGWWQGPWGNAMHYDEVRIHARPNVSITSGPVPAIGPEFRIPNGASMPTPTIEGFLTEPVWNMATHFDIRYGSDAVRQSYGNPLKWRAGQYQPPVNEHTADIADTADASVKWFFKGNNLYMGFDVRDEVVQSGPLFDRWDGFVVMIEDRVARYRDRNLETRRLGFHVGPGGAVVADDYLAFLRDTVGGAQLGLKLKPGTTVDTTGNDFDTGYTAELSVDLTKLGYPPGLGDGALFVGVELLDGDSYTPFTLSYGTRTWWGREATDQTHRECCPATAYLDPSVLLAVGDEPSGVTQFALLGNQPNPFTRSTTIRFALPEASHVTLEVYDLLGRRIENRVLGLLQPGIQSAAIHRAGSSSAGLYLYRLLMTSPATGALRAELAGKMMMLE